MVVNGDVVYFLQFIDMPWRVWGLGVCMVVVVQDGGILHYLLWNKWSYAALETDNVEADNRIKTNLLGLLFILE
jgi:hypothetical protein